MRIWLFFSKRSFVPGSTSFPSRPHRECGTIKRGSSQEANEAASLQRVFRERCIVTTKKVFIETRATCPAMWNNSVTPPAKRLNVYYKICHRSHLDAPEYRSRMWKEDTRRIYPSRILIRRFFRGEFFFEIDNYISLIFLQSSSKIKNILNPLFIALATILIILRYSFLHSPCWIYKFSCSPKISLYSCFHQK